MISLPMMIAVACGGAIGATLRYLVSLYVGAGVFGFSGPLATLCVNIVGSCAMGMFACFVTGHGAVPEIWRGFFAVGLLGALTTFSSFALDAGTLWQRQGLLMAGGYVALSVILSLFAFAFGCWILRYSGGTA